MLKKFGPLRHVWSMRFESKHKLSKMAAAASCNRQNICKTLAINNQLILNDLFIKKKISLRFECGKKSSLSDNHVLDVGTNVLILKFQPHQKSSTDDGKAKGKKGKGEVQSEYRGVNIAKPGWN